MAIRITNVLRYQNKDLFSLVFHLFFSYFITESLISECLYWDRQFRYRWVKRDDFLIHSLKYACVNKFSSFYETYFEHFLQKQKQTKKKMAEAIKMQTNFWVFRKLALNNFFLKKAIKMKIRRKTTIYWDK